MSFFASHFGFLVFQKNYAYGELLVQIAWIVVARSADWKPVQFLSFVFVYRIFEKLKAFEAPVSTTFTVRNVIRRLLS